MTPEQLADEAGLLEWARTEHQVLLRATAQATAAGLLTPAWQMFAGQVWLLGGRGYWADWRAAGQAVLAAAQAADDHDRPAPLDRWKLAGLLAGFGSACRAAGDLAAAAAAWQQALHILDDLGLPANHRIRARLRQASPPSPPG